MSSHISQVLPSLTRKSPLFSRFSKTSLPLPLVHFRSHRMQNRRFHFRALSSQRPHPPRTAPASRRRTHSSSAAVAAPAPASNNRVTLKAARKARRESPEGILRHALAMCSKNGDVVEALRLYDEAKSGGVALDQDSYNSLLYLCSSSPGGGGESESESGSNSNSISNSGIGVARGFEIISQMVADGVAPNEATFTSAARLAVAAEDPDMAFELVKQMKSLGIPPKLRSYGPALYGFCKRSDVERAFEVDAHMVSSGVAPEENELAALTKVGSEAGDGDRVYQTLHRLRAAVRQVSEETAGVVEGWFGSKAAARVGAASWDPRRIKEAVLRGGGGWHGIGWLGTGEWRVERTNIDGDGICLCCKEKLVCIDIDPTETKNFAHSLAKLAFKRETKDDFVGFQDWLKRQGPFDAVVDGANVGLVNQKYFNFFQLKTVVNQLRQISPSKRMPLVILHRNRLNNGPALNPKSRQFLESLKSSGSLYATPIGSNDDWYWLYAAVSNNCLLVTNDEMRDHLFQLLGTSFFPRWKEKHQVRLPIASRSLNLHMPPTYSNVIQESEDGRWHIPTVTGDDIEAPRQWLCATRKGNTK